MTYGIKRKKNKKGLFKELKKGLKEPLYIAWEYKIEEEKAKRKEKDLPIYKVIINTSKKHANRIIKHLKKKYPKLQKK